MVRVEIKCIVVYHKMGYLETLSQPATVEQQVFTGGIFCFGEIFTPYWPNLLTNLLQNLYEPNIIRQERLAKFSPYPLIFPIYYYKEKVKSMT